MDKLKSIDDAINRCQLSTTSHKDEARKLFRIIVYVLSGFALIQVALLYQSMYNKQVIKAFKATLSEVAYSIDRASIPLIQLHRQILVGAENMRPNLKPAVKSDTLVSVVKNNEYVILVDTLYKSSARLAKNVQDFKEFPDSIKNDFFKVDNTSVYILYGIFILVFGVLTSFYRYHLKEVAKYEHFLFGFERIRIAGNNSSTGYDGEVKTSLSQDAFTTEVKIEKKEVKKQIESPIPGHPTSDIATALFNKILEAVEVTPKSKEG